MTRLHHRNTGCPRFDEIQPERFTIKRRHGKDCQTTQKIDLLCPRQIWEKGDLADKACFSHSFAQRLYERFIARPATATNLQLQSWHLSALLQHDERLNQ